MTEARLYIEKLTVNELTVDTLTAGAIAPVEIDVAINESSTTVTEVSDVNNTFPSTGAYMVSVFGKATTGGAGRQVLKLAVARAVSTEDGTVNIMVHDKIAAGPPNIIGVWAAGTNFSLQHLTAGAAHDTTYTVSWN